MTGTITEVPAVQAAVLYSFEHARRDLRKHTAGLPDGALWRKFGEVASVGFHIRHIAGSVDRLITYAANRQLTQGQLQALAEEHAGDLSREQLFKLLEEKLLNAEEIVRSLNVADLQQTREIGRRRVPVPLGVLLVHIAEHTQRHVGAAIVTAKLARAAQMERPDAPEEFRPIE